MNTLEKNKSPKTKKIAPAFAKAVFDVLSEKHDTIYTSLENKQLDYYKRLRNAVEDVRSEVNYDNSDRYDFEKRLLAKDDFVEAAKEKLRNHKKLKPLFDE